MLLVLALAGGSYLAAGYVIYDHTTRVTAHCGGAWATNTPNSFELDGLAAGPYLMPVYDDVEFSSRGDPDVVISGWWIPSSSGTSSAVVQVHGLGSCKRDPINLLEAGMLHRLGFNVLMIDLRNEGESTITNGRYAGGLLEYRDVLGAWDWLQSAKSIPAARIGLAGFSMGAAAVLIAAGQESRVRAVWEDSGFADINVTISDELARRGLPGFLAPAATLVARLDGLDLSSLAPVDVPAKMRGRDLAVIHGTADTRLPVKHAYALIDACASADLQPYVWLVAGVEHMKAITTYPEEYERRLGEFFSAITA